MESAQDNMLFASFNQDTSCFAVGTEKGFKIFNSFPFKDSFERNLDGGIGIVEMLNRCNILALVGGGKNPKYAPNKIVLWDDNQVKVISELRFTSYVKNVKLKKEKLIVVCEQKIYVFNFVNLQNLDTIETFENPKGIIAVSGDSNNTTIAFPEKSKGYVRVKSYDKSPTTIICAHESPISALALNQEGTLLATASEKGTIIRIFNTENGDFLQEVRRGSEKAEIYCLNFDPTSTYLACSSDRGTIHIFSIATAQKVFASKNKGEKVEVEKTDENEVPKNQKSIFGKVSKFLFLPNFFNSEWSFAQFKINESKSICAFGPNNSIIVITSDGNYYHASFDPKNGGPCTKINEYNLNLLDKDSN